jgi:hypothetical protein
LLPPRPSLPPPPMRPQGLVTAANIADSITVTTTAPSCCRHRCFLRRHCDRRHLRQRRNDSAPSPLQPPLAQQRPRPQHLVVATNVTASVAAATIAASAAAAHRRPTPPPTTAALRRAPAATTSSHPPPHAPPSSAVRRCMLSDAGLRRELLCNFCSCRTSPLHSTVHRRRLVRWGMPLTDPDSALTVTGYS